VSDKKTVLQPWYHELSCVVTFGLVAWARVTDSPDPHKSIKTVWHKYQTAIATWSHGKHWYMGDALFLAMDDVSTLEDGIHITHEAMARLLHIVDADEKTASKTMAEIRQKYGGVNMLAMFDLLPRIGLYKIETIVEMPRPWPKPPEPRTWPRPDDYNFSAITFPG